MNELSTSYSGSFSVPLACPRVPPQGPSGVCWRGGGVGGKEEALGGLPLESVADTKCFETVRCSFLWKVLNEKNSRGIMDALKYLCRFWLFWHMIYYWLTYVQRDTQSHGNYISFIKGKILFFSDRDWGSEGDGFRQKRVQAFQADTFLCYQHRQTFIR